MKPIPLLLIVLVTFALPAAAVATGGDEAMEDAALKAQPARTLAQQALAVLDVRKDEEAAIMRIDAALESKDREDVDLRLLAQADEALDGGDRERAVELLNRALGGGPLPVEEATAPSGAALHNAGRAFEPNSTVQETIAAIAGAALLLLGGLLVLRHRRHAPAAA
jgi:tetratricopeptide (TPR) repeat protein